MPPSPIGIENDTQHTRETHPYKHRYRKRYPAHQREHLPQRKSPLPSWVSKTIPGTQEERTHTNMGIENNTRQ